VKLPFSQVNDPIGLPIWALGTSEPVRVMLIDDDNDEATLTRSLLDRVDDVRYELDWVSTFAEGLAAIGRAEHDAYLIDQQLGGQKGTDLVREARQAGSLAALIMMTGQRQRATDVAAMHAGATDFLMKGRTDAALLDRTLRYAITQTAVTSALEHSRNQMAGLEELGQLLMDNGPTPEAMDQIVDLIVNRFGLPRVAIYLLDGDMLRLAGQRGYEYPVMSLSRTDYSVERVARAHQPIFVPSLSREREDGGVGSDVATELSVPLMVGGELAGLLNVASLVASPIGEADVAAIRLVADRLTAALEIVRERRVAGDQLRRARQQLREPQAFVDAETSAYCRPMLEPLLDVAIASAGSGTRKNLGMLLVACDDTGPGSVTQLAEQTSRVFTNRPIVRFANAELAVVIVGANEGAGPTQARDLVRQAQLAGIAVWCGYAAFTKGSSTADLIAAAEAALLYARRVGPGTVVG
jgi:FixJ family two-component response regulator